MMVLLAGALVGTFAGSKKVKAYDGDVYVEVTKNADDDTLEKYYYKSASDNNLGEIAEVSYDSGKHELTLDNFNGCYVNFKINDKSVKDIVINVKGTNRLVAKSKFDEDSYAVCDAIFVDSANANGNYNTNLSFKGDGNFYLSLARNLILNKIGDVEFDGPHFYMNRVRLTSYENVIRAQSFIMKSGSFDLSMVPNYHYNEGQDCTYYEYYNPVKAEKKIEILGGECNIKYEHGDDDKGEIRSYSSVVFDVYGCEPILKGKINFDVFDEIKEDVKLTNEYGIRFKINRHSYELGYDDPNEKSGLSWNEKTKTLTMDGFECESIVIIAGYKYDAMTIVVKNINIVNNFVFEDIDVTIKGDGELQSVYSFACSSNTSLKAMYYKGSKVIFDGPTMDCRFMRLNALELKSGLITMKVEPKDEWNEDKKYYDTAMILSEGLYASGGTIIFDVDKVPEGYENKISRIRALIYLMEGYSSLDKTEILLEDCVIIVIDPSGVVGDKLYEVFKRKEVTGEILKKKNVEILRAESYNKIPLIDINRFDVIIETPVYYDGKAKTPKVKVGGLREGKDYTVTYENNVNIGKANVKIKGIGLYKGTKTAQFEIFDKNKKASVDKNIGKTIEDKNFVYRIISDPLAIGKYGKAEVVGLRKKSLKKIRIKNTIKFNGKKYKITSIGKNAFKDNKKIKSVTIGKNVTKIGSKAFFGCKKLKKVVIKSKKLKKIGKKAFKIKAGKSIKVSVPKKMKKKYKKLFKAYKNIVVK